MYYSRDIKRQVNKLLKGFPVLSVTGPRQSGKTTFLQHQFPKYGYFNLENPQTLDLIQADPQLFLRENPKHIIIDEVQRYPELLSYIQAHVDGRDEMGSIIISGSQNLLISEKISQSLAGRAAYQTVYPFSIGELKKHSLQTTDHIEQMLRGFYPALYSREVDAQTYYPQYIATYVERDARLIRSIENLSLFRKFIGLLAGRVGQVLNVSSLAFDTGISPNTAEDWISILEASYLVYRLPPYYKNIGKRLIKSPKVYFSDTGLLCSILNLNSRNEVIHYHNIGNLFENFIIGEVQKTISNSGQSADLCFYRDSHGNELDLLIDHGITQTPIEIKSATTFSPSFLKGINYWQKTTHADTAGFIIYAGDKSQEIQNNQLLKWSQLDAVFK